MLGFDPVTQAADLRPHVGSQLQDSALPDRLRVAEAVKLFRTPHGRDGAELLEQFGLAARRRSAFASLSGGERQRLFLVLALLNRPRLVILDELTQGLDPAARRDVWAAIRQLNEDGTTVLLVTHEMDEAESLCNQVLVMRAGRLVDAGAPAELVDRHAAEATIRFSLQDHPPGMLDSLGRIDGVRSVDRPGRTSSCAVSDGSSRTSAPPWSRVNPSRPTCRCTFRPWRTRCSTCCPGRPREAAHLEGARA